MIQIKVDRSRLETLKRTCLEMEIDFIQGSDNEEQTVSMFLLCDGESAFYLGAMYQLNRVDSCYKDIYRERKS